MAGPAGRTVVIGLELGDARLVHDWAQAGLLPSIRGLIQRGHSGSLGTTADQLHISAWPSIYTGASAGEHGVYFTFQPAPGVQGHQRFYEGIYGRPTFWRVLDNAGRQCAVLDAPYSHPENGCRAAFVHDWGCWAHYLPSGSTPRDLITRMERSCGKYPLGLEANDLGLAPLDPAEVAPRLVESVRAKAKTAAWLWQDRRSEILFTVFGETHAAGHYCWSEDLLGESTRLTPSPMLSVYQEIDRAIESLAGLAGDDGTVIVISGDSVAPNRAGWHLLPAVLGRLGFLADAQHAAAPANGADTGRPHFDPVKALRDLLPKDFRKSLARMLPMGLRDRLARHVDAASIDWSHTKAYTLPTDLEGYIRINLQGREPLGTVQPGQEYERVTAELMTEVGQLRDPRTGRAIVRDILRADREFPGDRRDWLPDLIVRWDSSEPIDQAASARIGTLAQPSPDPRPGTHAGPGFVVASGPGIASQGTLAGGHILDFAPSLLARLGVPVPKHMRGRVWDEWVETSNRARSRAV